MIKKWTKAVFSFKPTSGGCWLGNRGGGGGGVPEYKERPEVTEAINWLMTEGKRLFGGDWLDWLKPIGEVYPAGAREATERAQRYTMEEASKRGGLGSSALLSKIGDIAKEVQYADWYRAMEGRRWGAEAGAGMVGKGGGMGQRREEAVFSADIMKYQAEQAAAASRMKAIGTAAGYALSFIPGVGTATAFGTQYGGGALSKGSFMPFQSKYFGTVGP